MKKRILFSCLSAAVFSCGFPGAALAQFTPSTFLPAVIGNGSIYLGINPTGELNVVSGVGPTGRVGIGLFDARTGLEATFDGCTCEGWGAADGGSGTTGWANTASGSWNVVAQSFVADASTATSVVSISGITSMLVTQAFMPSSIADLYKVNVTITNTSSNPIVDLRYRRVMDWDIEPTPFHEYVTNNGTAHPNVWGSSDNGFASGNPLSGLTSIAEANRDFVNSGPLDHGALFDFQFGQLDVGASRSFAIYYGASATENAARAALASVGAEVFSLAKSSDNLSGTAPGHSVFTFGFDIVENDGAAPDTALLGTIKPDGSRDFEAVVVPNRTVWIDPEVAVGYDYVSDTAILTAAFEDLGDADGYNIYALNDSTPPLLLAANWKPTTGPFAFADYFTGPVFAFRVDGIDPGLELDPHSVVAFKTGLTFDVAGSSTVHVTQTALTLSVGSGAPEPGSWALLIGGFGLVGWQSRRRRRLARA